jgi:hypothetical protein
MTERRYAGPALPHPLEINWREPEVGFWMVYARQGSVLVPSRIFWCDWEPGNEENKLDRWPIPFLAGEIAGRWVDPADIWERVLLRETRPNHWRCAHPLVPQDGLTVAEEYEYRVALLTHAKEHRPTSPLAKPYKPVDLSQLPVPFAKGRVM